MDKRQLLESEILHYIELFNNHKVVNNMAKMVWDTSKGVVNMVDNNGEVVIIIPQNNMASIIEGFDILTQNFMDTKVGCE
jgi:hypothetical protein